MSDSSGGCERRGWRERIETGVYRAHRVACQRSGDRKAGGRCGCPLQVQVPGARAGLSKTVTLPPGTTVGEARREHRRLRAAGRPEPSARAPELVHGTLDEHAAEVFRARAPIWAANTLRNRDDDYRRRIAPTLGSLALRQVDRPRIERWLAELVASGASHRMIVQTVATVRVILEAAVAWGRLPENPARRLRVPRRSISAPQAAERVIGRDDLERVFAAAGGPRTETMLRAAGEAGLRRGEVAGLRWGDVNLPARRLEVRRQIVQERLPEGGHRKVVGPPKGGRARRVAISSSFAEALGRWYAEAVVERGAPADSYVWPGHDGGPMHDRSLARALERACERAGVVDGAGRALVSPHRLRHSAASVMLREGVPWPVVAAQLGHADPAITARIYSHLIDDRDLDLAAGAFEELSAAETMRETMRGGEQ